jgi:hypothetical protein
MIAPMGRRVRHAAACARRADAATFAGKGHSHITAACRAPHPHKSPSEDAAVEKRPKLSLHKGRQASLLVEYLRQKPIEMRVEGLMKNRVPGPPPSIEAFGARRARCWSEGCEHEDDPVWAWDVETSHNGELSAVGRGRCVFFCGSF